MWGNAMTPKVRLIRDFAFAYAGALVLVVVLVQIMQRIADAGSSSAGSIVPLVAASFYAGSRFAERERVVPDGATAWSAAVACALVAFAISLAALGLAVVVIGEAARAEVQQLLADPVTLAVIVVVLLAVHVLVVRFLVPLSARMQIRNMEKRQGR